MEYEFAIQIFIYTQLSANVLNITTNVTKHNVFNAIKYEHNSKYDTNYEFKFNSTNNKF